MEVLCCSFAEPLAARLQGCVDLLVGPCARCLIACPKPLPIPHPPQIFNPPYVPTPPEEVGRLSSRRSAARGPGSSPAGPAQVLQPGISRSWAGGTTGRQVIDAFLPQVPP